MDFIAETLFLNVWGWPTYWNITSVWVCNTRVDCWGFTWWWGWLWCAEHSRIHSWIYSEMRCLQFSCGSVNISRITYNFWVPVPFFFFYDFTILWCCKYSDTILKLCWDFFWFSVGEHTGLTLGMGFLGPEVSGIRLLINVTKHNTTLSNINTICKFTISEYPALSIGPYNLILQRYKIYI